MITVLGTFGDSNILKGDDGQEYKAYPYALDADKISHKHGFFLLNPKEFSDGTQGYAITNYLVDEDKQL
jgi:hypothetical protein